LAKIAIELEQQVARRHRNGAPGGTTARRLAQGDGWTVSDVVCTCSSQDRPFEEHHPDFSIAVVTAGSFEYHSSEGRDLMTPGSLLLGNAGQCFECAHEHGAGDRCLSFGYAPDYFEQLAADSGIRAGRLNFRLHRLPPLRALAPVVARACAGLSGFGSSSWEELNIQLAARAIQLTAGIAPRPANLPSSAVARVTRAVRAIERDPDGAHTVESLAREAGLSPYHFLRTFERLAGATPHQYVLRARLREAAVRLADADQGPHSSVLDIAFDCGFGDLSNFNRAFRAEFGVSPRVYRGQIQGATSSNTRRSASPRSPLP
jgi:AraC family transcriptional regulator